MTRVVRVHEVFIRAPLQACFEYVSDLTRHPEWSSGELRIEAAHPGPVAVGKEYISHGQVAVQKERFNTVRITHYEPPREFGFLAHDPSFGDVSHLFTFTQDSGGVLVRRAMTLSLNPVVAFLFRLLIYPLIGRPAMDRSLALLKSRLEHN